MIIFKPRITDSLNSATYTTETLRKCLNKKKFSSKKQNTI
jgi:hypothetical protein